MKARKVATNVRRISVREALEAAVANVARECMDDPLNPCDAGGLVNGKAWGGGEACWICRARAALAQKGLDARKVCA